MLAFHSSNQHTQKFFLILTSISIAVSCRLACILQNIYSLEFKAKRLLTTYSLQLTSQQTREILPQWSLIDNGMWKYLRTRLNRSASSSKLIRESKFCSKSSVMSRVIPNRKQLEEKTNIGSNIKRAADDLEADFPPSRGLDFYDSIVLFRSDDYIVIDKPHGVRMNGAFEGISTTLIPSRRQLCTREWTL